MRPYCIRCGVNESIQSERDLKERYEQMDAYIKSANKRRIPVIGDGHCLPRAVFRGAKNLNLLPQFITYSGLFKATVQRIETDINRYTGFITESVDSAIEDLNSYLIDKKNTH